LSTSSKKDKVLHRLMAMASAKWGSKDAESMRSSFETAAQAITVVDAFQVAPDEEPNPNPIRSLLSAHRKRH
jgi:hypothetical protein